MKKSEIRIGGLYRAKVSNKLVTVRVDAIRETSSYQAHRPHSPNVRYDVTNLATGRKTTFRSAAKFRSEVIDSKSKQAHDRLMKPPQGRRIKEVVENAVIGQETDLRYGIDVTATEPVAVVCKAVRMEDEQRSDPPLTTNSTERAASQTMTGNASRRSRAPSLSPPSASPDGESSSALTTSIPTAGCASAQNADNSLVPALKDSIRRELETNPNIPSDLAAEMERMVGP